MGCAPALGNEPEQVIERCFRLGAVTLDYRCALYGTGLRLDLATSAGDRLGATVRLKAPVAAHVAKEIVPLEGERRFAPWALDLAHVSFQTPCSGHPDYIGRDEDVFENALAIAHRAACLGGTSESTDVLEELEGFERVLAEVRRRVQASCNPPAFAVARRFHPLARFYVYGQLVGDPSGRIEQLAHICPGALLFAAGLQSCGGIVGEAAHELIREIIAGRQLARVLRGAVQTLLIHEATMLEDRCVPVAPGSALAVFDGSPKVLDAWTDRMRLFVRRAGPRVSPLDLCAMPPPLFAPEDIPKSALPNARWYAAMRVAALSASDREWPDGTWAFLSRNALSMYGLALAPANGTGRAWPLRAAGLKLLRDGMRYADAIGRWPKRSTSSEAWLTSMQSWVHLRDELVFPGLDVAAIQMPGVELSAVRTALELAAEGRRMDNCVADRCDELLGGDRWIFAGSILGRPVTVEVAKLAGRYELQEAFGFQNSERSSIQWSALCLWVDELNELMVRRDR